VSDVTPSLYYYYHHHHHHHYNHNQQQLLSLSIYLLQMYADHQLLNLILYVAEILMPRTDRNCTLSETVMVTEFNTTFSGWRPHRVAER
jgi:hypothetical protein